MIELFRLKKVKWSGHDSWKCKGCGRTLIKGELVWLSWGFLGEVYCEECINEPSNMAQE